ncbi:hypothetical protein CEXT_404951 [Caerostris extrusa]|uniref:Uncharacterized protein n=1 Tax=Caerostris extrusa TaxID=172846 RepID=A0AAV4NTZ5_CAEEX|nr:hypothetical protein CEXT_404951 [Caerostris extrusa]
MLQKFSSDSIRIQTRGFTREPPTQTFENKKKKILLENPEKPETISGFVRKFEKVRFREQTCWPKNFGWKTRAFDFQ